MAHYKNGRPAANGDPVVGQTYGGSGVVYAGTIHSINPGQETCNATVAEACVGGVNQRPCVNVSDLYHAEDAFKAIDLALKESAAREPSLPIGATGGKPA